MNCHAKSYKRLRKNTVHNRWVKVAAVTVLFTLLLVSTFSLAQASAEKYFFTGTFGSGMSRPCNIAIDGLGNIYVLDWGGSQKIQKFSSDGVLLVKWGSGGASEGQFSLPMDIAVDAVGNVYVADTDNYRIQKFSGDGTFLTQWGSGYSSEDGKFKSPNGIAVDGAGNVYVVDTYNQRIQKFSSDGVFLSKWGSIGFNGGQFNNPRGIAIDSAGNVYVLDTGNNRVQKFSSEGVFLNSWGTTGSGDGQFSAPQGIDIDSAGNVYVADTDNNRIQKFSGNGVFLASWGSKGSGNGEFNLPSGVAVDSAGNVYVADTYNGCVQKFGFLCSVTFTQTGLATGTSWTVTFNGTAYSSTNSTIVVSDYTKGEYAYSITTPTGYVCSSPTSGTIKLSTASTAINVTFNPNATPTPTPTGAPTSNPTSTNPPPNTTPNPTNTPTPKPTEQFTIQLTPTIESGSTTTNGSATAFAFNGNISASQISNAKMSTNQELGTSTLSFTVSGQAGTTGSCNITIPKSSLPNGVVPTLYIDGKIAAEQGYTQDTANFYVWFSTHFSTHQVSIEFATQSSPPAEQPPYIVVGVAAVVGVGAVVAVLAFMKLKRK